MFRPAADAAERAASRRQRDIPADAFVVGCVAALKRDHKRADYLIREVAAMGFSQRHREGAFLLLAGATTDDTPVVERLAGELLPGRHRIMRDVPRNEMPDVYRCMDVFVLPSLFEMMPIAILEAMASGVPVLVNRHPNLAWIVGERLGDEGGRRTTDDGQRTTDDGLRTTDDGQRTAGEVCVDMATDGALASAVAGLTAANLRELGRAARLRAERVFSRQVVIEQYVRYYEEVMGKG
jgi:glycosyltransferase involved in cell wall biosynthesis